MKPFTVPEMTFKRHSRLWAMSSFIRSYGLSIRDWKSRQHLFSDEMLKWPWRRIKVTCDVTIQYSTHHLSSSAL